MYGESDVVRKHAARLREQGEDIRALADQLVARSETLLQLSWVVGGFIGIALDHIEKKTGTRPDLLSIPLDDEKVLSVFGQGLTVGVFQFESSGMRALLRDLAFERTLTLDDLVAATALYRPGPMDSGLLEEYVAIKQGLRTPFYEHPAMERALKSTDGVMIYQEGVMNVLRELAGFTMADSVVNGVNGTSAATLNKDGSVRFEELTGTVSMTNVSLSGGYFTNLMVDNTAGALNATLNNVDSLALEPKPFFASAPPVGMFGKLDDVGVTVQKGGNDLIDLPAMAFARSRTCSCCSGRRRSPDHWG